MHGKGKTGRRMERQEARCAEITPAPVWNGATRRGAGRRRMEKLRGIKKKLLRVAEKLSEGKNGGCAGGPSLWRAVEHRWVIFVCALINIKIKNTGYEPFLRSE